MLFRSRYFMIRLILAVLLTIIAVNVGLLTSTQAMLAWGILTVIWFIIIGLTSWLMTKEL